MKHTYIERKPWRCDRLANAVARLREAEPDPRQKDEWLLWRVRQRDISLAGALEAWSARMAEWNATWLKETGGHLE